MFFSGFDGRKPFQDASKPLYNEFPEKSGPHLGAHFGIKSQKKEGRELTLLALERVRLEFLFSGCLGASREPPGSLLGASWGPPGSLLGFSFGGSWVYWLMDGLVGCRASRIAYVFP